VPDPDDRSVAEYIDGSSGIPKFLTYSLAGLIAVAAIVATIWLMDFRSLLAPESIKDKNPDYLTMDFEEFLFRTCSGKEGPRISQCDLLERRFCNDTAVWQAVSKYMDHGNHLAAARFGEHFLQECGDEGNIAYQTIQSWYRLTEYDRARRVLDAKSERVEQSYQFATWSGFVAEAKGNLERAAEDFSRALTLFPDHSKIHVQQFVHLSSVLEKLDRHCEARATILRFVGFDPRERLTDEIKTMTSRQMEAGSCDADDKPEAGAIQLQRSGNLLLVNAALSGTNSTLILDTGAEFTVITEKVAAAIGLDLSRSIEAVVSGIGGQRPAHLGYLPSITVGNTTVREAAVMIVKSEKGLFAEGVDGLLGQSFLSRFLYSVSGDQLTLKEWQP